QGRPALVQAGGSPEGRRLAGEHADAVFTAEMTLEAALEHYRTVKDHARRIGRDPNAVKVLPGFALVIASTEREAVDRFDEWEARGPAGYTLARLSSILGVDVSGLDPDAPLPEEIGEVPEDPAGFPASLSFRATTVRFARERALTVRELLRAYGGYGHPIIIGTPERVADTLAHWFLAGAADGFNLMPDVLPEGLTTLVDEVLPLLRARGLFRSGYEAPTLRGRLGGLAP
ncbi:MAG: LLM class flavin-dependent oxidoreductase, partial [Microbacterium sp.]